MKGNMVTTKFLRRVDLKKRDDIKFCYPCYPVVEDKTPHKRSDIVLVLPKPIMESVGTQRTKSMLIFQDDRLKEYNPLL